MLHSGGFKKNRVSDMPYVENAGENIAEFTKFMAVPGIFIWEQNVENLKYHC